MGVDIGTNLGLAKLAVCGRLTVDSLIHSSSHHVGLPVDTEIEWLSTKLVHFRGLLNEYGTDCALVWYEYVPPSVHTAPGAARLYGAFESALILWSIQHGIKLGRVTIAEGKRALSGDPGATKDRMMRAAGKWNVRCQTHDQADAIGVVLAGYKKSLHTGR